MKRIIRNFIFIVAFTVLSVEGYSINKIDSLLNSITLKQADRSFENMAYVKAIDLYTKLVNKEYESTEIIRNLAVSYFKIGETQKAQENYELIIYREDILPEDYYNYSQTLKYNGQYKESDRWLEKYAQHNTDDSRNQKQANTEVRANKIRAKERYKIEELSFNSKYSDFGPAIHDNKLYFASARNDEAIIQYKYSWKETPYLDIYEVNLDGIINKPKFLSGKVNTKFHDGPACFNTDGSEMFFTRNNSIFGLFPKKGLNNVNNLKIYHSKIVNGEVSKPEEMHFNSEDYSCGHPSISTDGQYLFFASDMPGGYGGTDIYYCTRTDSSWSEPINMGAEINTEGEEMFPFIHHSGDLYFSSNGHFGLGGLDVFIAHRSGNKFEVKNMGYPLNTEKDDFSFVLDESGETGYFSSNREGGKGDDDIYKVILKEKISFLLTLQGAVSDSETGERIEAPTVELVKSNGETISLDANTNFDFISEIKPDETYKIKVSKADYYTFEETIIPENLTISDNTIIYPVKLKKEPFWGIYGKVYFKETMEEIPGVNIHIEDVASSFVKRYVSDSEGLFRIKLKKGMNYKLLFEKDEVFAIRAEYSTVGREPGWVNADEFVQLAFEKVELNKTIEIPNIYYDLAKWNIRDDAAVELDKVVQFLLDNSKIQIELGSHTDARGSSKSNQSLSQKRAQSAVDYIVNKGIDRSRITAKGYGEERLKNKCADGVQCSEAEHQENRRTEIRITGF